MNILRWSVVQPFVGWLYTPVAHWRTLRARRLRAGGEVHELPWVLARDGADGGSC